MSRPVSPCAMLQYWRMLCCYRCPVLTYAMLLHLSLVLSCAMLLGTDVRYAATPLPGTDVRYAATR
eukprot:2498430-Rhodomonas_salina.1